MRRAVAAIVEVKICLNEILHSNRGRKYTLPPQVSLQGDLEKARVGV